MVAPVFESDMDERLLRWITAACNKSRRLQVPYYVEPGLRQTVLHRQLWHALAQAAVVATQSEGVEHAFCPEMDEDFDDTSAEEELAEPVDSATAMDVASPVHYHRYQHRNYSRPRDSRVGGASTGQKSRTLRVLVPSPAYRCDLSNELISEMDSDLELDHRFGALLSS